MEIADSVPDNELQSVSSESKERNYDDGKLETHDNIVMSENLHIGNNTNNYFDDISETGDSDKDEELATHITNELSTPNELKTIIDVSSFNGKSIFKEEKFNMLNKPPRRPRRDVLLKRKKRIRNRDRCCSENLFHRADGSKRSWLTYSL